MSALSDRSIGFGGIAQSSRSAARFALGVGAFMLIGEIVFQWLPTSSATRIGLYIDPHIPTYAPHHAWRFATGWDLRNPQHFRTNNVGFVADHDFARDSRAVALVGDSYVEAANLDARDRPGAQLERALPAPRPVYALGSPGTSLLDYAQRMRFAHTAFGIQDFVVFVESGDVRQALCGSGNVGSECLDPRTLEPRSVPLPAPSAAKRLLRHSALLQYLMGQLKIDPSRMVLRGASLMKAWLGRPLAAQPAPAQAGAPTPERIVDTVTTEFFERARRHVGGRLVLVVDCDRRALQAGREVDDTERERFIASARAQGAIVVDTKPIFAAHFQRSPLSLDVAPQDQHLNRLGVELVARAAAFALQPKPP